MTHEEWLQHEHDRGEQDKASDEEHYNPPFDNLTILGRDDKDYERQAAYNAGWDNVRNQKEGK